MRAGWIAMIVVFIAANIYVVRRLWVMLPLVIWAKVLLTVLYVAAFGCIFFNFSGMLDKMPDSLAVFCYETGNSFPMIFLYLLMLLLVMDIGCRIRLIPDTWVINSFLGSIIVLAVMSGLFIYGNAHYHHKYREELHLTTSKPLAKPLKIVMISDLHIGYHNRRPELARWVNLINAERPDLVLIAGDIIDISVKPLIEGNYAAEFRRLRSPVYSCLGNHEYFSGGENAEQFFRDAGITLLRDEKVSDCDIEIIGRDDRTNAARKSLAELEPDSVHFTILLDHQPAHLEEAENAGIDFQFSGHTHHGQIWPISLITELMYEDAFGPCQKGDTRYYVTSGLGIWGGKFRIGTRSEYVVVHLSRNEEEDLFI